MTQENTPLRAGFLWLGSAALASRLLDLGALVVVLSFVTPEQLGSASIAWSVGIVMEAAAGTGIGIAAALIQARDLSAEQLHSAHWYSVAVGTACAVLLSIAAPFVADYYHAAEIAEFLYVGALRFVVLAFAVVPLSKLNRELRFREVAASQTLGSLAAAIVRIAVAVGGGGAWALVLALLAQAVALFASTSMLAGYRPRWTFAAREIHGLVRFGWNVTGSNVASQLARNVDYLLVGRLLGLDALGVYRVAFDLAMEPVIPIGDLVNKAAMPYFPKLADDRPALAAAFMWTSRTLSLLATPVLLVVFVAAPDLLLLLAKGRFVAGVDTARILVVAAAIRVAYNLFPILFVALGHTRVALRIGLGALAVLATALYASMAWLGPSIGLVSVAIGWLLTYPLLFGGVMRVARSMTGITTRRYLASHRDALVGLLWMGPVAAMSWYGTRALPHPALRVAVQIAAVLAAYAAYLRVALGMRVRDVLATRPAAPANVDA